MELRDDSGTKTAGLSGFLRAIRDSSILSGPQLEKLEADAAEDGYFRRAFRLRLAPGEGRGADRVPGEADPQGQGAGPGLRPLRHPRRPRPGGDGPGLQGVAPHDGPGRRAQDPRVEVRGQSAVARPVPSRDATGREARSPQRGPGLRRRSRRRALLHRHGVLAGSDPAGPAAGARRAASRPTWSTSRRRPPTGWPTPTRWGSCTATSSRRTCS